MQEAFLGKQGHQAFYPGPQPKLFATVSIAIRSWLYALSKADLQMLAFLPLKATRSQHRENAEEQLLKRPNARKPASLSAS